MAGKLPYMKFYVNDWLNDSNLRLCSHAARGFWINLLCLLWNSEERGVAITGNTPWTDQQIAGAVGGDTSEALRCLTEILDTKVCSRNKSGAVFCRRMVRDQAELKEDASRKRKAYKEDKRKKSPANLQKISTQFAGSGSDSQIGGVGEEKTASPDDKFEQFWTSYPRRLKKKSAHRSWNARVGEGVSPDDLVAASKAYATACAVGKIAEQYQMHPTTFLGTDERFREFLGCAQNPKINKDGHPVHPLKPDSVWIVKAGKHVCDMTREEKNRWNIPLGTP